MSTGIFIGDVITTPSTITKLAFKQRLTQEERIAIREAAKMNPVVEDFQDLLSDATFVDLTRPDTVSAVNQLASVGLIDPSRVDIILNYPIQSHELYRG